MRAMSTNFPVEYVDSCAEDMDNIVGVYKPDYSPIPSRSMNPLEKIIFSWIHRRSVLGECRKSRSPKREKSQR